MNKIIELYQMRMLNPLIIAVQYFFFAIVILLDDFFAGNREYAFSFLYEMVFPIILMIFSVYYGFATLKRNIKAKRLCIVTLQIFFTPYLFIFLFWLFSGHVTMTWILASGFYLFTLIEALTGEYNE